MGNTSTAVEESEFVEESNTVEEPKIAYKTVWYCTLLFTVAVPRLKSVF